MANRIHTIKARLDDEEFKKFLCLLKESKLTSSSEYIRQATLCSQIKPPPSPELVEVLRANLRESRAWGNNLNQLALVSNASGYSSPAEIRDMQEEQKRLSAELRAVLLKL